jgi:hypothetical protein
LSVSLQRADADACERGRFCLRLKANPSPKC